MKRAVSVCPPVIAAVGAGVSAAGTLFSGLSQAAQYRAQAKVADRNAALETQQTQDAIQRGTIDRQNLDRKYASLAGSQQAAMASNGIDLGFGSAAQVGADTAMMRNEDAAALYKNQSNEIRGHDINVANLQGEANAKRSAASGAIVSAVFGAAGTALGGASQYRSLKGNYGKPGASAWGVKGSDGIY